MLLILTFMIFVLCSLKDKDVLTYAVLRYAFGGWSNMKWSVGNSPLVKVMTNPDIKVSAFNAVHADTGLFGVIVSAPSNEAKKTLIAATEILTSGKIPAEVLKRAKNQLKNDILHSAQNGDELCTDIGQQVLLLGGKYKSAIEIAAEIDKVSSSDISRVSYLMDFF